MSNTNTEVLTTAYEKLQGALTQSNTVLPKLEEALEKGDLQNYAKASDLEDIAINAKMVGFKTDGSDNSGALTTFKTLFSGKKLYFPDGIYCFSKSIELNNQLKFELSNGAELKLISTSNITAFIDATGTGGKGNFLTGGTINGNNKCDYTLRLSNLSSPIISRCIIKNFNKAGLKTSKDIDNRASNAKGENLYIYNETAVLGSIGILDDAYDNSFSDITIRDVETMIDTTSSKFNRVHGWLSFKELIPTSVYAIMRSSECCFINCTSDTIRYSFISGYEGTVSNINYVVALTNMTFFYNKSVYTQSLASQYKPVLFKKYTNSNGVESRVIPNLTNATITGNDFVVSFTDCAYPESMSKNVNAYNVIFNGDYVEDTDIIFERNLMWLKDLNTERYRDGNTNFDTIVHNGTYTVNTWSGESGKNVPAQNISGVLIVIGNGTTKTQILNTKDNIYTRAFTKGSDGTYTFKDWIKFSPYVAPTEYKYNEFIKINKNNGVATLTAYVSTDVTAGDSLFTIPENYRPSEDSISYSWMQTASDGTYGSVKITAKTTGELLVENNNIYRGQIVMNWII